MVLKMVRNIPLQLRSKTEATAELQARMEELERLKDQMQAVEITIAKAVSDATLILNHDTNPFPPENVYSYPEF